MIDMMTFPETWEEFEKSYGFDDSEEVYTNGSRLIPSFRVKQWLDHIAHLESKRQATNSSDCISRQDAKDVVDMELDAIDHVPEWVYDRLLTALDKVPSAEPEQLEKCPIYGGVCLHPSDQCYECPRHAGAEQIIRCTNCRFFKRNIPCTGGHYNGCEMWLDDGNEIRVMTDDYCSKALPKEGEQDGDD